ncbi:MAG: flagellar FlbD family protein [bacterium]|nr:flagellar FlbD family protein [bacterium]
MVRLTRLDGTDLFINARLIELVEASPDTVISLTTGRKVVVTEAVEEVVERVLAYHRSITWPPVREVP